MEICPLMVKTATKLKPFAWSHSALDSYETCPKKHYHTRIAKDVPDPPGEAALWGQRVHKALENRIGHKVVLPKNLATYERYAAPFDRVAGTVLVEQQIALNRDMGVTKWFAKDAWVRGVLDVTVLNDSIGATVDWKTGKRKPSDQLELAAALMFCAYPDVTTVHTSFAWLKEKKADKAIYSRAEASEIWRTFLPRVTRMEAAYTGGAEAHPPKPSGLCNGWCPVKKCEFWNPRR